jgi:hypothetical protein
MTTEIPRWDYRERCLEAKGEECIVCGTEENIIVHHVDGDRENNDLDNLIPVCEPCHGKIHAKRKEVAEWVRALGKQPKEPGYWTVGVCEAVWSELNRRKRPGDTFDDVLRDVLGIEEVEAE